jgi:hypothetical protein
LKNPLTLFVVGAGASKEVGLPVASELIDVIADALNYKLENGVLKDGFGDADVLSVLQESSPDRESITLYLDAAKRLRDGVIFSNSIDSFIDIHRHDEKIQRCGKLAIAKTILASENASCLQISNNDFTDVEALRETWFVKFFKNLCDGVRKTEVHRLFEKTAFVVFNYDRCLEHFLFNAIQRQFGVGVTDASDVMRSARIFHPYGSVGELPWQNKSGIPFGFTANRESLKAIEKRIKTYTEQLESRNDIDNIRSLVAMADVIVFLGFSYHPQNMALLNPSQRCDAKEVLGTAYDISHSNVDSIKENIRDLVGSELFDFKMSEHSTIPVDRLHVKSNLTCAELFDEFSRRLFTTGPAQQW